MMSPLWGWLRGFILGCFGSGAKARGQELHSLTPGSCVHGGAIYTRVLADGINRILFALSAHLSRLDLQELGK